MEKVISAPTGKIILQTPGNYLGQFKSNLRKFFGGKLRKHTIFSGPGEFAVTAGWGVTGFEGGLSPTLMMLQAKTFYSRLRS